MGRQASAEERAAFADRTAELYRLFKKGVRPTKDVLKCLQDLIDGAPHIYPPADPTSLFQAGVIMGSNMYGIDDTVDCFHVAFTDEAAHRMKEIPFSAEVLKACADTHVLVACGALSLMDIWKVHKNRFNNGLKGDPWFKRERFAVIKTTPGWQLVRKDSVQGSIGGTWEEQNYFLGADEQVPSTSVLLQTILLSAASNDISILDSCSVRTSDVACDRTRVFVSSFLPQPILVNGFSSNGRVSSVGLASCKKPN